MDDLATLLPTSKATWLLIVAGVTTLAFALSAFASDRLGHTIISPFLAIGAWLFGAFAVLGQRFHGSNHIRRPRQACRTKCG